MRSAICVPNFGEYADPRTFVRLATVAERAGWDGIFVWDHLLVDPDAGMEIADPWILLAAAAMATDRIRLGPMVTPLPRRRPWIVARQAVSLDHLSGGRVTLGVGLGEPPDAEFEAFGEPGDLRTRAARLDEALAILDGLWGGEPFAFEGEHHRLRPMRFLPRPVQRPRIPIWVAGTWPNRGPFHRAARWDGAFPVSQVQQAGGAYPLEEFGSVVAAIREDRGARGLDGFDVALTGETEADPDDAGRVLAPYVAAGMTWWLESISEWRGPLAAMERRIRAGPARIPGSMPAAETGAAETGASAPTSSRREELSDGGQAALDP